MKQRNTMLTLAICSGLLIGYFLPDVLHGRPLSLLPVTLGVICFIEGWMVAWKSPTAP